MTDCSLLYAENFAKGIFCLRDETAMERAERDIVI